MRSASAAPRKLKRVVTSAQVPPATTPETATVEVPVACPPGMRSVAGGFLGEADTMSGAAIVQASYKLGAESWLNSALNVGGPFTRNFASIVYCARDDVTAVAQSAPVNAPAPQQTEVVTPACARFLQTGGFKVSPPDASGRILIPLASRPVNMHKPVDQGWLARAIDLSGGGTGALATIAYCR